MNVSPRLSATIRPRFWRGCAIADVGVLIPSSAHGLYSQGMRTVLVRALVGAWLLALAACHMNELARPAPLRTRNQHPTQLTAMHLAPRAARAVGPGRVDLGFGVDWTSLWLRPGTGLDRIELDGELVRIEPSVRIGLGDGLDLEVSVPFLHSSGGGLDRFIEAWHRLFGLPQNERDQFPRNRTFVQASRRTLAGDLDPVYRLDSTTLALGDIPIAIAWFPEIVGMPVRTGIRAGVEFPTGSERRGLGNGEWDASVQLLAEWDGGPVALFGWAGWTAVGTAGRARAAGISYADVPSVGFGAELALTESLTALTQVEWERSVLANLDNNHARRAQGILWVGARYRTSERGAIEAAVGEDLIRSIAPDVTFHLAFEYGLGPRNQAPPGR